MGDGEWEWTAHGIWPAFVCTAGLPRGCQSCACIAWIRAGVLRNAEEHQLCNAEEHLVCKLRCPVGERYCNSKLTRSCACNLLQVCDRWANFDTKEAEVICRQMELPTPARSVGGSYFGAGTGPTLVSASEYAWNGCQGNEETWDQVRAAVKDIC